MFLNFLVLNHPFITSRSVKLCVSGGDVFHIGQRDGGSSAKSVGTADSARFALSAYRHCPPSPGSPARWIVPVQVTIGSTH
jgi:hypothetical protein